ncbi:MAG: DUF2183 domain-containing protein [Flavobacteriales bacterium]|nr:DUF2183 domain-containing protein [Flavobacteriales bacterium]
MRFISRILDKKDPVHIMPFGGYANDTQMICRARVLEDEGIAYTEDDGKLRNIWNSFKRFESDEWSDVLVRATLKEKRIELISDREGYVEIDDSHDFEERPESMQWLPVEFSLSLAGQDPFNILTRVMQPGKNARFGIISDVDDTVIHTGVSSRFKWRLMVNSVAAHSYERKALNGAAGFYSALHKGPTAKEQNPVFYVSNSPWNLHEYLSTFLQHHSFPEGTLLLRDFGLKTMKKAHPFLEGAKYKHVVQILKMYPHLPFILLGDAAELDADIYLHIAKEFPEQIQAIYIRAVDHVKRTDRVKELILAHKNRPIYLVGDMQEAQEHARTIELI